MNSVHTAIKYFGCVTAMLLCFHTTTKTFAQQKQDSVIVLPMQIPVPANAKKLGTIKAGDNALTTRCDYEDVIRETKQDARNLGGNIVKITQLIPPAFISKCYRIQADVYHTDTLPSFAVNTGTAGNNATDTSAPYALLCLYRLRDTLALEPTYALHLNNDSVICKVKGRWHEAIKIYDTGTITLWAKTDHRKELKLKIKTGETYYIRCGLVHGDMRLVPIMELIDPVTGAYEYNSMNKLKKDVGLEYLKQVH